MNRLALAMQRSAWVAALFSAVMLAALGWNAFSSRAVDPNPPTRVDDLVTRINLDPNNKALLSDLRRQDDWLRSSYFRSIRFGQTGFFLLLGGVGLFLVLAKSAERLKAKPPVPDPSAPAKSATDALTSQKSVLALGMGLAGVLALVATLSRHDAVAAYVDGKPLPQVTPTAPASPAGLPPAGTTLAPTTAAAQTTSPNTPLTVSPSSPAPSGPIPLGGTSLGPLPVSNPATSTPPAKPPAATGAAGKAEMLKMAGWPWFRGPASGFVGAWNGPSDWDATTGKGLLWKANLTLPGWNSPIIDGGKVFLSGADDKHREICAFDLATGRSLWRLQIPVLAGTAPVKPSNDAGYAPSTTTTDGKRVFAAFVDGNVVCVSTDGKPIWGRQFGPLENSYGFASSLLFAAGRLIVQMDQGSSPEAQKSKLYGLDPVTGKTIWETPRAVSASWSSPIALSIDGKPAVVVVADPGIAAYDVASGTQLWHAEGLSGEIAASSTFGGGKVYIAQQGSIMMAVSATNGKIAWKTSDPALPDIGSLAYGSGLVFLSTSDGTFSAIDGGTGKIVWEKRLEKPARSSPIVVGDEVYLLGLDGVMRVFRASKTFSAVGRHRLGEPAESTPAFAGGRMVIRGDHHLFCIGAK